MSDLSPVSGVLDEAGFRALTERLIESHRTWAPQLRDASVVLDELHDPDDLVRGVTLRQEPGSCRVEPLPDGDRRRFAWAVGPTSAKAVQHPARRKLFAATPEDGRFELEESGGDSEVPGDGRGIALLGVRPCDVAAMAVLGRVLGDATQGGDPLVVAVNCTEPGGTCFCASMGTGPALGETARAEVDVELWERPAPEGPTYLVGHVSERGAALLEGLDLAAAPADSNSWTTHAHGDAAQRMGRTLSTDGLPENLLGALGSQRWDEVAARCLSCGNCTMVCPTCFCHSVHDVSDLRGTHVERWLRWDSCFSLEHSYLHGGSVRVDTSDRYRQWLTHKLSTWWGQFGESGCVGCGRCISWCPVGIDIVEEAAALASEGAEVVSRRGPAPTAVFLRERGVPA